jgi:xanthine dehydrogenase YagR molybdenum-binding subunit
MTDATGTRILGAPADRVDGPLKVTGAAPYPSDVTRPGLVHAALVHATITAGKITRIGTARAEDAPGVLAVITHQNAPALPRRTDDAARSLATVPAEGQPRSLPSSAGRHRGGADA